MAEHPIIEAKDVNLVFQTDDEPIIALKDVSFEVKKGELISFIGPSGCG